MSDPAAGTLEMQITGIKANERRLCQYRVRASPGEARTSHNSFSLFHFSSLSLSLYPGIGRALRKEGERKIFQNIKGV